MRQICLQSAIKGSANEADLEQTVKLLLDQRPDLECRVDVLNTLVKTTDCVPLMLKVA